MISVGKPNLGKLGLSPRGNWLFYDDFDGTFPNTGTILTTSNVVRTGGYFTSATPSGTNWAATFTCDPKIANVEIELKLKSFITATTADAIVLIFNRTDGSNWFDLVLWANGFASSIELRQQVAGSFTIVASATATIGNTDKFNVITNGDNVIVKRNDSVIINYTNGGGRPNKNSTGIGLQIFLVNATDDPTGTGFKIDYYGVRV